jgi:hypothetical protein
VDGRPITSLAWTALLIVKRLRDGTPRRTEDEFEEDGGERSAVILPLPEKPGAAEACTGVAVWEEAPLAKGTSARMPAHEPRLLDKASE